MESAPEFQESFNLSRCSWVRSGSLTMLTTEALHIVKCYDYIVAIYNINKGVLQCLTCLRIYMAIINILKLNECSPQPEGGGDLLSQVEKWMMIPNFAFKRRNFKMNILLMKIIKCTC